MEDYQVLIDSLGNYSLSALMDADVQSVRIWPDEIDRTARIEICLRADTWDSRSAAIAAMADVREVFLEDLSLEYFFGPSGDAAHSAVNDRASVFAA